MKQTVIPELIRPKPAAVAANAPFLFRFNLERRRESGPAAKTGAVHSSGGSAALLSAAPQVLKPLFMHDTADGPVIIDGHRRMHAAHRAGLKEIPAFLYAADAHKQAICELALSSALEARHLSGVERITAAYKISHFLLERHCADSLPLERIAVTSVPKELLPSFGTLFKRPVSERFLLDCFEILTLSYEELEILDELGMQVEHIVPLLELTTRERRWLLDQKKRAAMSTAEMRKLSRLLTFARSKEGFHLGNWERKIPHPGEKPISGASLIGLLKREIYPEISKREKNIASCIKNLELPNTITITPPENLEGDSFSCHFTFASSGEFRRYMNLLRWAGGDGKIKKLVDELNSSSGSKE